MNTSQIPNIGLLTTEDLLIEVMKRYTHAIFSGLQIRPGNDNPEFIRSNRMAGDPIVCAGLASVAMQFANDGLLNSETDMEPDEL
jgi:hypothetical protein